MLIKTVNERVNYQKIELARLVNDLEQMNHEIESQTEIMRFMASSFDINKNINVIVDAFHYYFSFLSRITLIPGRIPSTLASGRARTSNVLVSNSPISLVALHVA